MARDILGEYGPESSQPQAARATSGGVTSCKEIANYKPPVGPIGIKDGRSPGLHGTNHGTCGTQSKG